MTILLKTALKSMSERQTERQRERQTDTNTKEKERETFTKVYQLTLLIIMKWFIPNVCKGKEFELIERIEIFH